MADNTKKAKREAAARRHESLAQAREARWLRRKAQIEADVMLPKRLQELFLDRTLWGVPEQMQFLDTTNYRRITALTQNRFVFRSRNSSFSAVLPSMDAALGEGDLRPRPAIEAGRLRQWAWDDHRVIFNVDTGELEINPHWRAGNKRSLPKPKFKHHGDRSGDARRKLRGTTRKPGTTTLS